MTTDTFNVKGVDIVVEYNDFICSRSEIEKLLEYGVKSMSKFEEIQSELEIKNYLEIRDKLFPKKGVIEKTLDLTNYMPLTHLLNQSLETLLSQTFRIGIIEHVGGNTYKLRGPKSEFKDLEAILSL